MSVGGRQHVTEAISSEGKIATVKMSAEFVRVGNV